MLKRFEYVVILLAGSLVAGTVALAVFSPPVARSPQTFATHINHKTQFDIKLKQDIPSGLIRINTPGAITEGIVGDPNSMRTGKHSANALDEAFNRLGYNLDDVSKKGAFVPRVFLASLPKDLDQVRQTEKRKAIFFRSILPLILQANEEVLFERTRLMRLNTQIKNGQKLDAVDRLWLIVLAERYKTKRGDMDTLMKRVDIVPPSLALAQAAEESGWGTSRFSRIGNAIFGEWTFSSSEGVVPQRRDEGKYHRVKIFKSLLHSVRAYIRNLNSHRAYNQFRKKRHAQRSEGNMPRGYNLVDTLLRYSERGEKYIRTLRLIMVANKLDRLDKARLGHVSEAGRKVSKI
ncbi:MAG: hypothetical protein CMF69_01405 [Magnetovibrio sp.]|nr:hypothetical protein [Magnetovibrio sp.]|tara:strand:- start:668 stop:1711 length:1044 start_codon:yes stop_codon:yes gene_type:complete